MMTGDHENYYDDYHSRDVIMIVLMIIIMVIMMEGTHRKEWTSGRGGKYSQSVRWRSIYDHHMINLLSPLDYFIVIMFIIWSRSLLQPVAEKAIATNKKIY